MDPDKTAAEGLPHETTSSERLTLKVHWILPYQHGLVHSACQNLPTTYGSKTSGADEDETGAKGVEQGPYALSP